MKENDYIITTIYNFNTNITTITNKMTREYNSSFSKYLHLVMQQNVRPNKKDLPHKALALSTNSPIV